MLPRRILCPVDFSETARTAAHQALELAREFQADLLVLHAWEIPLAATGLALEGMAWAGSTTLTQLEPLYRDELGRFIATLETGGVKLESRLEQGAPGQTVVRVAETWNADWIVMGSEGRTGVARWLLGSVAQRVVAGAHCPVLIVRRKR